MVSTATDENAQPEAKRRGTPGRQRLKLRARLYGGYVALILLALGLAATGVWGVRQVGLNLLRLEHDAGSVQHIGRATEITGGIAAAQLRFMYDGNKSAATELAEAPDRLRAVLTSLAAEGGDAGQRAALADVVTRLDEQVRGAAQLTERGDAAAAARERLYRGGELLARLTERLVPMARQVQDGALDGAATALERSVLQVQVANWRFLATRDASAVGHFRMAADRADFALNPIMEEISPQI